MCSLGTTVSPWPSIASTQAACPSPPSILLAAADNSSNARVAQCGSPSAADASAQGYTSANIPRSEEDITQYVLYDGLLQSGPAVRHARELQWQAYLHFTHRIRERLEAAHAIVLSANPLSLSVMASQLRMYRWKVTEAQTLLETTSLLQDFVMETSKRGYRVRRRPVAPLGISRYAHGRGKSALRRIAEEEREKLANGGGSVGGVLCASTTLPTAPTSRIRADQSKDAAAAATDSTYESAKRPHQPQQQQAAAPLESFHSGGAVAVDSGEAAEIDDGVLEVHEEDRLPLPPPDALPRLVLVDSFTHEDFADIARHIRYVDKEHGLELLLVLLLPTDPQAAAIATQGAGYVVTPQHETTFENAYNAGYDLVLAHNMDNLLVDFLTNAFVSSAGRWRNDVRSKAAVGNYMSVRNVLLGGLDTVSLQQRVWDDSTDDAEVLELLGAQSLFTQGGGKGCIGANSQLREQQQHQHQQQAAGTNGQDYSSNSGHFTTYDAEGDVDGDADKKLKRVASSMMSSMPRLRGRPTSIAHFGVRLPADQQSVQVPLTSFGKTKDVLSGVMASHVNNNNNSSHASGGGPRRRHFEGDGAEDDEDDMDYCSGGLGEDQRMLRMALEKEMGRLMAENDGKQASIDALQNEVESLHRTVAILKRRLPGGTSGGSGSGTGPDLDSFTPHGSGDPPDSGSTVHLSKQQQIYILKERLEAANDQIVALLKGGQNMDNVGNSSTPNKNGNISNNNNRGRSGNASKNNGRGSSNGNARSSANGPMVPPAAAARRAVVGAYSNSVGTDVYRRRAYESYQAAREAEMMTLLDDDAHYINTALAQLLQQDGATSGSGSDYAAAASSRASSAAVQRREREATDQVIHSLQSELRSLQSRLDGDSTELTGGGATHGGDLQARMATHLQAALERLEAQRQRVRHLEELRQTDQLLLTHAVRVNEHVKRELNTARRNGGETDSRVTEREDDSGNENNNGKVRGTGKNAGRTRTHKAATATAGEGSGGGDDGRKKGRPGARKKGNTTPAAVAGSQIKSKEDRRGQADGDLLDAAQVEGLIAAAVTDAVAARNRVFRRQLGALVQTCKAQLTRVMLKHQKPCTSVYMQMLQEELEQAKRDQRGAFMRLQFLLSHLRPDQYDATCIPQKEVGGRGEGGSDEVDVAGEEKAENESGVGDEEGRTIPLRAVTDADVRQAAERIAREHAVYALRAAYMTTELERVRQQRSRSTSATAVPPGSHKQSNKTEHEAENKSNCGNASSPVKSATSTTAAASGRSAFAASRPASSASPDELLHAYQNATQQVKAAIDGVSPMQTYLDAVQAEMEAEQRLSPWCDVDCTQLFQSLSISSSAYAIAPPPHLALVPTNLRHDTFPSTSEFTLQSMEENVPLYFADVDGSMRDVADVYCTVLRSFVTLGEGWSAGYYTNNNNKNTINNKMDDESSSACSSSCPTRRASHGKPGKAPAKTGITGCRKGNRKQSLDSGELTNEFDTVEMDEDLNRLLSVDGKNALSLHQALAQLPVRHSEVSQYQGRLDALYTADLPVSPAQRLLYEILLRAYRQHCINPLHMALLEMTALTTTSDTNATAALTAAQAQHREVVALLQLLVPTATPALRSLHQELQNAQRLLQSEESEGPQPPGSAAEATPHTSSAFLAAVDTALLGCIVDELRWRQWRRARQTAEATDPGTGTAAAEDEDDTVKALIAALAAARTSSGSATAGSKGLIPTFDLSMNVPEEEVTKAAVDARVAQYYATFCAARAGVAGVSGGTVKGSRNGVNDAAPGDLFNLNDLSLALNSSGGSTSNSAEAYQRLTSLLPNTNGAAGLDSTGAGRAVAQELAEYFSKRRATAGKSVDSAAVAAEAEAEAAFLTNTYLNDDSINGNGDGGDEDDENRQAIRRLRKELTYMEALRQQRMAELAMRSEWHLRRRNGSGSGGGSASGRRSFSRRHNSCNDNNHHAHPEIDPERLNFMVKSGTSAWYGMEAAKRVRAILRRRELPDQIIVGGGPEGGGVGIELSRRTAQPAVTPSPPLPPVTSSLQQQQQQQSMKRSTLSGVVPLPPLHQGGVSRAQPQQQQQQPISYVSPRDAASLSAYANLASGCDVSNNYHLSTGTAYHGTGLNSLAGAADDLGSRVVAYRAELTRAAGRLSPTSTSTYANGAPYCLPLSSKNNTASSSPNAAKPTTGMCPRSPLPQQTSWVYGVPNADASALVQQQSEVDPRQPRDTVLFMPPRARSSIAEAVERSNRTEPPPPSTVAVRTFTSRCGNSFNTSFSPVAVSSYITPAAMAAQRLQTMLNASMKDPLVIGVASATSAASAALRTRQFAEQQCQLQLQQQKQQQEVPSSSPASPRISAESTVHSGASAREPLQGGGGQEQGAP